MKTEQTPSPVKGIMLSDSQSFIAYGLLKDAAFQLSRLTGENLIAYARTFSALAKTHCDIIEKDPQ